MKIKTLLFAILALALAMPASVARSQMPCDPLLTRMVAWFTGDPNVLCGPEDCGPKNYAEDTCCADGGCGCCSRCCRCLDTWGSVEFLMWWAKGTSMPPLVTTSLPGTPQAQAGVIGLASTSTLFGDQLGGNKLQGGGRVTAGIWLDADHNVAAGGRFFGLGGDTSRFSQSSTGNPILAIPFFNAAALVNQPDANRIAFPNFSSGSINAYLTTNNIIGADAFAEIMMYRDSLRRIDLVGGYQFFRLDDWLQMNSHTTGGVLNPFPGLQIDTTDRFSTHNQFHGGELGLRARMARGQWSLNVLGQVGLGNMNQQVTITGTTATTPAGSGTLVNSTGLFAQASNSGTFQRNKFAFLPQIIANLNYHVNPNLSFHIGYNMLWISDLATSAQQIDTSINPAPQLGGPARPRLVFRDSDYWLQGINWGFNWDF